MFHVTLHYAGDPDPYPIREWLVDAPTLDRAELLMRRVVVEEEYYFRFKPITLTDCVHELVSAP